MARRDTAAWRYIKHAGLWAGAVCLCIAAVCALWARTTTREHVAVFRLRPDDDGEVDAEMLEQVERILDQRVRSLARRFAISRPHVSPLGRDRVRVRVRSRFDPQEALDWISLRGHAEFRLLHPRTPTATVGEGEDLPVPPEGYETVVYEEIVYRIAKPGETKAVRHAYFVRSEPLVSVDGFAQVEFRTVGWYKTTVIVFQIPAGKEDALREHTTLNVGRDMALLIDGRVLLPARTIKEPVTAGRIQIQGYLYNPPLRVLVQMLQAGSLPCWLEREDSDAAQQGRSDRHPSAPPPSPF